MPNHIILPSKLFWDIIQNYANCCGKKMHWNRQPLPLCSFSTVQCSGFISNTKVLGCSNAQVGSNFISPALWANTADNIRDINGSVPGLEAYLTIRLLKSSSYQSSSWIKFYLYPTKSHQWSSWGALYCELKTLQTVKRKCFEILESKDSL